MITEPYPSLRLRFTIAGVSSEARAMVDTGFDGYLAVPASALSRFRSYGNVHARTASGEVVTVASYLGTVELLDEPGPVDSYIIALGDEYLVGIEVLNHFRVTFDHGQRVIVEP